CSRSTSFRFGVRGGSAMADAVFHATRNDRALAFRSPVTEPRNFRLVAIGLTLVLLAVFLLLPLAAVFVEAFRFGIAKYLEVFSNPDALAAIKLTLLIALIAVPCNLVFGIAAAWAIAKYRFPRRAFLVSLVDLPFPVSPVVAGLVYVLLLGSNSAVGGWLLEDFGIRVIFAVPGVV